MYKTRIILTILIIALLSGCSATPPLAQQLPKENPVEMPYDIITENGESYIVLRDSTEAEIIENATVCELAPIICFDSISEMLQDIKTGNFTEEELYQLKRFKTDDTGRTMICDLSKLWDGCTPDDFDSQRIEWGGSGYSITYYDSESELHATFDCTFTKESLDNAILEEKAWVNRDGHTMVSTSQDTERNATIYIYEYYNHMYKVKKQNKEIHYTITGDNMELFVRECYNDSDVPRSIDVFGEKNGYYFCVMLYHLQERPSVEWLSQFGVQDFVETSTT